MADISELIKQTLSGLTEKFKEASGDLHSVVAHVSETIRAVTGMPVNLQLAKTAEAISGTNFKLRVSHDAGSVDLFTFSVPTKGYPIQILEQKVSIANRSELEAAFASMAANPDSPLMQNIAFVVRQRQKADQ